MGGPLCTGGRKHAPHARIPKTPAIASSFFFSMTEVYARLQRKSETMVHFLKCPNDAKLRDSLILVVRRRVLAREEGLGVAGSAQIWRVARFRSFPHLFRRPYEKCNDSNND